MWWDYETRQHNGPLVEDCQKVGDNHSQGLYDLVDGSSRGKLVVKVATS